MGPRAADVQPHWLCFRAAKERHRNKIHRFDLSMWSLGNFRRQIDSGCFDHNSLAPEEARLGSM